MAAHCRVGTTLPRPRSLSGLHRIFFSASTLTGCGYCVYKLRLENRKVWQKINWQHRQTPSYRALSVADRRQARAAPQTCLPFCLAGTPRQTEDWTQIGYRPIHKSAVCYWEQAYLGRYGYGEWPRDSRSAGRLLPMRATGSYFERSSAQCFSASRLR